MFHRFSYAIGMSSD